MILEIFQALSPDSHILKMSLSFEKKSFYSFLSYLILATNLQMNVAKIEFVAEFFWVGCFLSF